MGYRNDYANVIFALSIVGFYPTHARSPLFVGWVKLGEVHQLYPMPNLSMGGGGGLETAVKSDYVICERPLIDILVSYMFNSF